MIRLVVRLRACYESEPAEEPEPSLLPVVLARTDSIS
jgi:hypothetical protein